VPVGDRILLDVLKYCLFVVLVNVGSRSDFAVPGSDGEFAECGVSEDLSEIFECV
jgi:hypothetical protein